VKDPNRFRWSFVRRSDRPGWLVRYKHGKADPFHTKSFTSRAAALEWIEEQEKKPASFDGRITVAGFADQWLLRQRHHIEAATVKYYAWALEHIKQRFGDIALQDVTVRAIQDWMTTLIDPKGAALKRKTVANLRAALHTMFEDARADTPPLIGFNPCAFRSRSKAHRFRQTKVERAAAIAKRVFSFEELGRFLATAEHFLEPGLALLFRVMAYTGLRVEEVIALQWADFQDGKLWIKRAITVGTVLEDADLPEDAERLPDGRIVKPTKTGSVAPVELPPDLLRRLERAAIEDYREPPHWIFPYRDSRRPCRHDYLLDRFIAVCKEAGIPRLTPKALRHTYASLQLARGSSPVFVQRQMRHEDSRMTTETYGSHAPWDNRGAATSPETLAFAAEVAKAERAASRRSPAKSKLRVVSGRT
jgi:integrase